MNNRKPFLIIAAVAGALLLVGLIVAMNNQNDSAQTSTTTQPTDTSMENMPADDTATPPPATTDPGTTPPPAASSSSVTIKDYAFSPASITVKKGTKVTWTNQDSVKHDVKSDTGKGLGSELLAKGESYSYTFNDVGTFAYHCSPHPYMKGTVVVTD